MGKYICSSKSKCANIAKPVCATEGTSTTKQSETGTLIAVCRNILHVGATD